MTSAIVSSTRPPSAGTGLLIGLALAAVVACCNAMSSAWLAARSDPPHYGKLVVYNFPKRKLIYGPRQIEARIDQDSFISQQLTLWNQRGSQVIRGNLLVIPIVRSLVYVEPLYIAAEKGQLPELKRVIVGFGDRITMDETLEGAMARVFGGSASPAGPEVAPSPGAVTGVCADSMDGVAPVPLSCPASASSSRFSSRARKTFP